MQDTAVHWIFSRLIGTSFIFARKPSTHKPASHSKLLSHKWERRSGRCDKNKTVSRVELRENGVWKYIVKFLGEYDGAFYVL